MIVAMMLPSSLPLMRRFGAIATTRPQPVLLRASCYGGYALVEKTHPLGLRLAPVVGAALIGVASIVLAYGASASSAHVG